MTSSLLLSSLFRILSSPSFLSSIVSDDLVASIPVVGHYMSVNTAIIPAVFYACYYLILSPSLGIIAASFVFTAWCLVNVFLTTVGSDLAWKYALGAHIVGWVAQFIGHGVFEGRAPALFDSLFESLLMAPMFMCIEVAFAVGLFPTFRAEIEVIVAENLRKFKAEKAQ